MRVLHVIPGVDLRHGGPQNALVGLVAAQRALGLPVDVVSTRAPGDQVPPELGGPPGPLGGLHLIEQPPGRFARPPALAATVGRLVAAADVVHVHAVWEPIQHAAAAAARRRGVPYLFRPCGMLDPWCLRRNRLFKRAYLALRLKRDLDAAAAVHYTTDSERDLVAPLNIRAPAIVEPNGFSLPDAGAMSRGAFRAAENIPPGAPVVLFLGRVHEKKNVHVLLDAFSRVTARVPDARLVVAGPADDEYGRRMRDRAAAADLAGRVHFAGMVTGDRKAAVLADADLFVLPSHQENFGVAVAEAMASGLPVVISDRVALEADVRAAAAGAVVPLAPEADAAERFAGEIARLLADAGERRRLGDAGRAFARSRYDWAAIADRWAGHYERIGRRASDRPAAAGPSEPTR